ncbi:MAG: response regulator [Firmicutes bacterium]|nr:response regulator [Bacillota bacterium]
MRILIVDDNIKWVDDISDILSVIGHQCDGFSDPLLAVEAYKVKPYDLVITDLVMPGIDGLQVAKAIKEYDPQAVVVIITGAAVDTERITSQKSAAALMFKPISLTELFDFMDNVQRAKVS